MKTVYASLAMLAIATALFVGCKKDSNEENNYVESASSAASKAPTQTKMDPVVLSFVQATQTSVSLTICAGSTGAPAGFTLQWMTAQAYADNGNQWYSSDDPRLCDASFSGNANLSRYNLNANECVAIRVGEFLLDNGASTNCGSALSCGTQYVFRAFAHATSTLKKSDFTSNISASTLACNSNAGCTYTQGYWKTHGIDPNGMNQNMWPADVQTNGLQLGTVLYNQTQLLAIFNQNVGGNGLIALAHQLIAAKLNVVNGASVPAQVQQAIADADALIGGLAVPPAGSGYLAPSATTALIGILGNYNEGSAGVSHCY